MKIQGHWLAGFVVAGFLATGAFSCLDLPTVEEFASGEPLQPVRDGSLEADDSETANQEPWDQPDSAEDNSALEEDAFVLEEPSEGSDDVLEEGPTIPKKPGESCTASTECESPFLCWPEGSTPATNTCTVSCCTSSLCPLGFVCVPDLGVGVCVAASAVGLTLGNRDPGLDCTQPWQCLSGRCEDGTCVDLCCSVVDCFSGAVCSLTSYESTSAWQCRHWSSGHTKVFGDKCSLGNECVTNSCSSILGNCTRGCCNNGDCGTGLPYCTYKMQDNALVRSCVQLPLPVVSPCCSDADCAGGKHCLPEVDSIPDGLGTQDLLVLKCQ